MQTCVAELLPVLWKGSRKGVFASFPSCAVISVNVLRVSGGSNREANSAAHSSSCPHFKTSRRPGRTDPDLNPALLCRILRRAGLFITQHALGVDEGESATQGYTREEGKEWERVQGRDAGLFRADRLFLWGSKPSFAA